MISSDDKGLRACLDGIMINLDNVSWSLWAILLVQESIWTVCCYWVCCYQVSNQTYSVVPYDPRIISGGGNCIVFKLLLLQSIWSCLYLSQLSSLPLHRDRNSIHLILKQMLLNCYVEPSKTGWMTCPSVSSVDNRLGLQASYMLALNTPWMTTFTTCYTSFSCSKGYLLNV